jgi:hypothetical protein
MALYAEPLVQRPRSAEDALARGVPGQQQRWHSRVQPGREWRDVEHRPTHRRLRQSIPAYFRNANLWASSPLPCSTRCCYR